MPGCAVSVHDMAANGNVAKVAAMLEERPELLEQPNPMGKTPLFYAVTYGREDVVQLLLDKGANVNTADQTGMTPLHVAATLDRIEEARLLIDYGADLEARDDFGDTPLHSAAIHGKLQFVEFLLDNGADADAENNDGLRTADLAEKYRNDDIARFLETVHSGESP